MIDDPRETGRPRRRRPLKPRGSWRLLEREVQRRRQGDQLGIDAQLSATEFVRRAERCIGLAIRKGQEEGRINRVGQGSRPVSDTNRSPVGSFGIGRVELAQQSYPLTDGISGEQFEKALAEAKAEKNLSRANVVRAGP